MTISLRKSLLALALIAVLAGGALSYASPASAKNSEEHSSLDSMSADEKQAYYETLVALLKQLIELLRHQSFELPAAWSADVASHTGLTEAEATVYTNETVVKIELNDKKYLFTTTDTSRRDIIDEIVSRYDLEESDVADELTIEEEDRASRASDKDWADQSNDDDEDSADDDDEDDDDDHGGGHDDDEDDN